MDNLESVNEPLGHAASDVPQDHPRAVASLHTKPDTVASIGGDQFAVILENTGKRQDEKKTELNFRNAVEKTQVKTMTALKSFSAAGLRDGRIVYNRCLDMETSRRCVISPEYLSVSNEWVAIVRMRPSDVLCQCRRVI